MPYLPEAVLGKGTDAARAGEGVRLSQRRRSGGPSSRRSELAHAGLLRRAAAARATAGAAPVRPALRARTSPSRGSPSPRRSSPAAAHRGARPHLARGDRGEAGLSWRQRVLREAEAGRGGLRDCAEVRRGGGPGHRREDHDHVARRRAYGGRRPAQRRARPDVHLRREGSAPATRGACGGVMTGPASAGAASSGSPVTKAHPISRARRDGGGQEPTDDSGLRRHR